MRILIISSLLVLAGCGVDKLDIFSTPIEIEIAKPSEPTVVHMQPVNFRVVTKDNLDAFIREVSKAQGVTNPAFIAISMKDYENLSLNLADLKRYIEQQKAIVVYYKSVTDKTDLAQ